MSELSKILNKAIDRIGMLHDLTDGAAILGSRFEGGRLEQPATNRLEMEQCEFIDVELANWECSDLSMSEVLFRRSAMGNISWRGAQLQQVEIYRSRLTGWSLAESTVRYLALDRCKCDLSVFHHTKFTDCRFVDCDLREADFQQTGLSRVTFRNCDLRGARFPGAKLVDVDFRGSQIADMAIDSSEMIGASIDHAQLLDVAQILGLKVGEVGEE